MLLSTQTDVMFHRFGPEKGIRIFAEAGFDAIDFSMFDMINDSCPLNTGDIAAIEKIAEGLRKCAAENGIRFNQAHAPFPSWQFGKDEYNTKIKERIQRSVMIAGILGADAIVVHPIARAEGGDAQKEFNLNFYRDLEATALEYHVKIALENMWGYDSRRGYIMPNVCSFGHELADYYDALNPDAFTVCLDLGHCGLVGEEPDTAIHTLGNRRLTALHVHDNNYRDDTHTVPYTFGCKMDWDAITKALGEIDYRGAFTYEADNFLSRMSDDVLPSASAYMAKLGRTLIAKIDAARPQK